MKKNIHSGTKVSINESVKWKEKHHPSKSVCRFYLETCNSIVLDQTKLLPRYSYHKSLLNWFTEGVTDVLSPQEFKRFKDCHIIIKCDEKQINELCLTSETEIMDAKAFSSGKKLMHS